jgi:hypothetical protein
VTKALPAFAGEDLCLLVVASVPTPDEVVDQAFRSFGVALDVFQGLLALGGDARGEEDVGVAGGGAYELHRDVATKLDLVHVHHDSFLLHRTIQGRQSA